MREKKVKFAQKFGMSTLRLRSVRPARTWILVTYILTETGISRAKSAHMSCIGSSQPPPSIPEWLSLVVRDEICVLVNKKAKCAPEIWLLTSTLQCTTPRRPYVIDGTSHAIQLELLHNTKMRNYIQRYKTQTPNKGRRWLKHT